MSLKSTIKAIEDAGFGYLKVELEAQLERPRGYDDYEYQSCEHCEGRGNHDCEDCDGEGYQEVELTRPDGSVSDITEEVTCDNCSGDGTYECSECEGEGEVEVNVSGEELGDEDNCQEFIYSTLSEEAKKAIIYGKFYNDGSVDSEFTFTIKASDAKHLPEIVDSFNKLAEEVGNGMDVDGAGMHIAVLPKESNGVYPVRNFALDNAKLQNFTTEVTKLLPALYIAATSGNFTRALNYRMPQIDTEKYSAIHKVYSRDSGGIGCLEYRLFETCYQRPDAIFEYLETIARTLEYYKDPTKKVKTIGKEFVFYDREGFGNFVSTPDQVAVVKKQLKSVIGKKMTLKSFQEKRELTLSVQSMRKDFDKKIRRIREMYLEAQKNYKDRVEPALNPLEEERLSDYESYGYFEGSDWTPERKKAYIRGISEIGTEQEFINRNIMDSRLASAIQV